MVNEKVQQAALIFLPILVAAALLYQDWLGWLLLGISVYLPFLLKRRLLFSDKELRVVLFLVILHNLASIANQYFLPNFALYFAGDSLGFIHNARLMAQGLEPTYFGMHASAQLYASVISLLYLLNSSVFVSQELSVLAFTLSCCVLLRFCDRLQIRHYGYLILFVFAINPNDILITSMSLREPWQLLACITLFYTVCEVFWGERGWGKFALMFASAALLASLHRGLYYCAYLTFFMAFAVWGYLTIRPKVDAAFNLFLMLCALVILFIGMALLFHKMSGFVSTMLTYRQNVNFGGSSYGITFPASLSGALMMLPKVVAYYLFYPFVWDIHRPMDVFGCAVGLVRLVLLFYAFYYLAHQVLWKLRLKMTYLLMMFFVISMVFSIGTNNYGTSMRHNIVTFWILALLGVPGFMLHRQKRRARLIQRNTHRG